MKRRLLLCLGLIALACNGFSQLIAWELGYDSNDPQDNEPMAESMIRVSGGDVVVAWVKASLNNSIGELHLRRVNGNGQTVWDQPYGSADRNTHVQMVQSGTRVHLIQTYLSEWKVVDIANGNVLFTHPSYPLGTDLVAHPSGDLATLDAYNGTVTLWSAATGDPLWTADVSGNLSQQTFLRGDANGNLYVGGVYTNGQVENGLGVTKVDATGSVGWTAAQGNQDFPPRPDHPADIAVDPANNALYVTAQQNYNSYDDDFSVTKFSLTDGSQLWNQMFDSGGDESGKYIKRLSDGSVVALSTRGQLVKILPSGAVAWNTSSMGYIDTYYSYFGMVVNSNDQIFIAGTTYGNRPDYWVNQIDPQTGSVKKIYRFDRGNGLEELTGISLASDDNIIVNGSSRAGGFRSLVLVKFQQANLTFNPNPNIGGQSGTATLSLVGVAPASGYQIQLGSLNSAVASLSVSSLAFSAGESSKTFGFNSLAVTSQTNVTLYAYKASDSYNFVSGVLTVAPSTLSTLSLSATSVAGGTSVIGTVTLGGAAPSAGLIVYLADNSTSVITEGVCYVPGGQTVGNFNIETKPVSATTNTLIYAHYAGTTISKTLQLVAPSLVDLTVPSAIYGGSSGVGSVSISGAAPSTGWAIAISDDSVSVSVPSSTVIPSGATTGTFNIFTYVVTTQTTATITARRGSTIKTATLAIKPPVVSSFTILPDALRGGESTTGLVVLNTPAPTGGLTVTIQNGAPSKVTTPATLFIPAGASSRAFLITTQAVTAPLTVGVYTTLNGSTSGRYLYLLP